MCVCVRVHVFVCVHVFALNFMYSACTCCLIVCICADVCAVRSYVSLQALLVFAGFFFFFFLEMKHSESDKSKVVGVFVSYRWSAAAGTPLHTVNTKLVPF